MTLPTTLATAARRSRLFQSVESSARNSRVYASLESAVSRVREYPGSARRWVDSSTVGSRTRGVAEAVSRWADGARVSTVASGIAGWAKASFLYRWLTAEPEPEVVVIDLRETLTLGPTLAVLDRTIRTLAVGVAPSGVRKLAVNVATRVRDAPIRVASLVIVAAVVVNTIAAALLGDLDGPGFGVRIVLAAIATLGVRVRHSWVELRDTRTVRLLIAALEPPEPPEASTHYEDEQDRENEN